jgi:hypothetical protein
LDHLAIQNTEQHEGQQEKALKMKEKQLHQEDFDPEQIEGFVSINDFP